MTYQDEYICKKCSILWRFSVPREFGKFLFEKKKAKFDCPVCLGLIDIERDFKSIDAKL
jgi:hypothetical protein